MEYVNKTLVCLECQAEFLHSAEEQERWAQRGLTREPKRCPACRATRRANNPAPPRGHSGGRPPKPPQAGPREFHPAVCADCGQQTTVPFKPREGRPVYCRDCLSKHRGDAPPRRP